MSDPLAKSIGDIVKPSTGGTFQSVETDTGHILSGKDDDGRDLTVVISGGTISALSLGDVYHAAASGVKALNSLLNGDGGSGGASGGCNPSMTVNIGNNTGTVIINQCSPN